ncbi:hypothetical protein P7K49_002028 [Saguinus oedipus]|uniref:Sulfhydryl oxidase flavin adenine dinucleotide (FAD) binding domain-containing protein n=1 Tax=Saguinus oedipus TaxID=9490 RepID=A0ABQ9WG51_SAGOE|nr:hypothetical protein P7K49_002028 [Saguinus oedipus]
MFRPRSKLYTADLESGLHYLLRVELAAHRSLAGAELKTLKDFVTVVVKVRSGSGLGCLVGAWGRRTLRGAPPASIEEVFSTSLCPPRPIPQLIPPVSQVPPACRAVLFPALGLEHWMWRGAGAMSQAPIGKAQLWLAGEETEAGAEAHTSAGSRGPVHRACGEGRGRAVQIQVGCAPVPPARFRERSWGLHTQRCPQHSVVSETTEGVSMTRQRHSPTELRPGCAQRTSQGGGQCSANLSIILAGDRVALSGGRRPANSLESHSCREADLPSSPTSQSRP